MRGLVLLILFLVVAGCTDPTPMPTTGTPPTTTLATSTTPRTGHEHSVYRMFDAGNEVSFQHSRFDFPTTRYLRAHLHLSGGEASQAQFVIHAEGELGFNLTEFFGTLGMRVVDDEVVLDSEVHGGKTVTNNATHSWQLWYEPCPPPVGDWVKTLDWVDHRPAELERFLVTFAPKDATVQDLQAQFDAIPGAQELEQRYGHPCKSG